MGESFTNLQQAWMTIADEAPDDPFMKIPMPGSVRVLSYRVTSFFKRVSRIANVLRNELKLNEGDRVTILLDDPNDLSLLMHGAWLARLVACPVNCSGSAKTISNFISMTKSKAVVFSPDASAKIASLFVQAKSVDHWLVTGSSNFLGGGGEIRRLETLLGAVPSDLDKGLLSSKDCQALALISPGNSGRKRVQLFSQAQLVNAAENLAKGYPSNEEEDQLAWASSSWYSLEGILHSIIVPLFSGVPILLNKEMELRRFWDHVKTDGFTFAVLNQEDLRPICRRGKSRRWTPPTSLKIMLYSKAALSPDLISSFLSVFEIPLVTCYHHSEAGGVVAISPGDGVSGYHRRWLESYDVVPAGIPLESADIRICNTDGVEVDPEVIGEICVKSSSSMTGYVGDQEGGSYLDDRSYLHTGDDGFYAYDESGRRNLFVLGRRKDLILRDDVWVIPDHVENILLEIKGIESGRIVGFPSISVGYEIGAYIVLLAASHLTEEDIIRKLSARLEWYECPKVIVFGKKPPAGQPLPSRNELASHFEEFFGIDYSRA